MECVIVLFAGFFMCIVTTWPTRSRMNGPGTVPLYVQYVYVTPSANCPSTSLVTRVTSTLSDADGAAGRSVADLLRLGALAGAVVLWPDTVGSRRGIIRIEVASIIITIA